MPKKLILLLPLLLAAAGVAQAGNVFIFTMNTSSISGDSGSLDFSLAPGAGSDQSLTATVFSFTGGSYGGTFSQDGNAAGGPVTAGSSLTLTANNASQLNDEFETFKYGNTLAFSVALGGLALTAPDGSATSSYEFDLSTYSDAAGTAPVLTTDVNGISGKIDISPAGVVSFTDVSPELTIAAAPEPGSVWLFAGAMGFAAAAFLRLRA